MRRAGAFLAALLALWLHVPLPAQRNPSPPPQVLEPAGKQAPAEKARTDPPSRGIQEWRLGYFYDDEREVLRFSDLAFPSVERGIAVGTIIDETRPEVRRPVALITGDGGANWETVKLEDIPVSVFFLDDSQGWMVTAQGIWKTEESGRSWKRLSRHKAYSLTRVWFLTAQRGFAVGAEKTVLETGDGGKSWRPLAAAAEPTGQKNISRYDHIAFANGQLGLIVGSAIPPRPARLRGPVRQVATMTLELETHDGGVSWKASSAPLLGQVADIKLEGKDGLAVFSYETTFEVPSEVYRLNLSTGKSESAFRRANRRVTSVALYPGPLAFLAAADTRGSLEILPGPVKIYRSTDLKQWTEMEVDYRAIGTRIVLAGADGSHVWAATDTGMLLQLSPGR